MINETEVIQLKMGRNKRWGQPQIHWGYMNLRGGGGVSFRRNKERRKRNNA